MSLRKTILGLMCLCVAFSAVSAQAQEGPPMPTEHHKMLEKAVGKWSATMKMMGMESTGTEVNKMICGGMFMSSQFKGNFNGMDFHGHGVYGYDPEKGKYVGYWFDNFSNIATVSEGKMEGDAMVMWSMMPNMATGEKVKTKMVDEFTDEDHRTLVFSQPGEDGKYHETMRIEYARMK